jgi:hypothetical protein
MAPRTVCGCQPKAATISSMVAPLGRFEHLDQLRLLAVGARPRRLHLGALRNATPFRLLGGRGLRGGDILLDAERVIGGRGGVEGEGPILVIATPFRLIALGADLLEKALADQA